MDSETEPFTFEYLPTEVAFGRGCVRMLGERLDELGLSRALVVCGENVGANRDVIEPVESALDARRVSTFDSTTPTKRLETVFDGIRRIDERTVDCVVAVGGGSSINIAKAMCLLEPSDHSHNSIRIAVRETGALPKPDTDKTVLPNVVIPTTMAGADLTDDGGVTYAHSATEAPGTSDRRTASYSDSRIMPSAVFYDPELFATTPTDVLAASAMNGFDKGIETVYSREATPVSRAHALQGLRYLQAGLPRLSANHSEGALDRSVLGILLVQYGRKTNIIHTFGNGVSDHCDVHQGLVHAVVAPAVLRYVFDRADAKRREIASALDLQQTNLSDGQVADAAVERLSTIRDQLGLPSRLRELDGIKPEYLPSAAKAIAANPKHARNPPRVSPSSEEILEILQAVW
ncbi:iron-containing alcohol dehydrogenase [Halobellus sp. GM3]|uniref:iron-containing alcohol dehydrogenase n=1 Tax=Halobellus sp. GM3 TaxID=3458410 RepID=UPI00403E0ADF